MTSGPEVLLLGAVGLVGIAWAVHLATRRQGLFLGVLLLVTALESTRDFALSPHSATNAIDAAFYIGHSGVIFSIGSVQVHIQDLFTVVAATAGVMGIRRFRGGPVAAAALAGLVVLVGLGVVTFAGSLGIETAVNSWRRWELALALLLYGMTTIRPWEWRDLDWIVAAGVLMCALAAAEISIHGLGSASGWTYGSGQRVNGRPIAEDGALILLAATWALALRPGRWTLTRIWMIAGLVGFLIVSQQRTIWLAALVSLAVWLLVTAMRSGRQILNRISWSFVGLVYSGFALMLIVASSRQLQDSLSNERTYQWRVSRWQSSFSTARSQLEWLVGGAFGPTPASVNLQFRGLYAHSLYVWSIETVGLAGLALMLVLIASTCLRPALLSRGYWPLVTGVIALTVGYSYGLPDWYWLAIAMCAGWPATEPRAAAEGSRISRPTGFDLRGSPPTLGSGG